MKDLIKICKLTDEVLIDILVKCMKNPSNQDFYIGRLTEEKLQRMINENKDAEHIYRTAYARAKQEAEEALKKLEEK